MGEINISHRTNLFFKINKKGAATTFESLPELLQNLGDARLLLKRKIVRENPYVWNGQYFFWFTYEILNKKGKIRKSFKTNGFKVELSFGEDVSGPEKHWNANEFSFGVYDLNKEVRWFSIKIKSTEVTELLAQINYITLILKELRYWPIVNKYYDELVQSKSMLSKYERFIKENNLEEDFKKFW